MTLLVHIQIYHLRLSLVYLLNLVIRSLAPLVILLIRTNHLQFAPYNIFELSQKEINCLLSLIVQFDLIIALFNSVALFRLFCG